MMRAGGQLAQVKTRLIKQRRVDFTLGREHQFPVGGVFVAPGVQRRKACRIAAILFIGNDNICRRQLVAEIVIGDIFFIQQLTRVEQAKRGAQINVGFIDR